MEILPVENFGYREAESGYMIHVDEIAGVLRIKMARSLGGRPFYRTTAYYVDGLLVDTGCAHCRDEFLRVVSGLAVERIVNTHSHEDHIGADASLKAKLGITPLMHSEGLGVLAEPRRLQPLRPYQRVLWGYPEPCEGEPLGDTVELEKRVFQVLHTPGHSRDHICLFEPGEGWMFTGDAFVGGKEASLRADYNIWGILDSLKKMALCEPKILFAAGGSVRSDAAADLKAKISHLEELGGQVLELAERGLSPAKIGSTLLGSDRVLRWVTLGHFSGVNLVRSFIEDRPQ